MSWINHVNQGSNQQEPIDNRRLADLVTPGRFSGPPDGTPTVSTQHWHGCPSPSTQDFPAARRSISNPPSLERLTCTSPGAGQVRDPMPISYVNLQEQRCVLSWFQCWNSTQRERFLQDLMGKAVPGKVCTLVDSLSTLQVKDRLPNIFECQLRLWTQWFESWEEEERNNFVHMLEEQDPVFVDHFYRGLAGTSGRD